MALVTSYAGPLLDDGTGWLPVWGLQVGMFWGHLAKPA